MLNFLYGIFDISSIQLDLRFVDKFHFCIKLLSKLFLRDDVVILPCDYWSSLASIGEKTIKLWFNKDNNMQRECRGQERVPLRKLCREIHPEKTNNQIETSIKVHLRTYRPLIKPERTPKSFKRAKVGEETGQQGRRKNESN
mmetsp:Transcript_10347/g.13105  ORF Transcript_10347/g.13105 Transcript_10347/m.13105 type:complete len:142 (+) Transcript_10347:132-557(+)